MLNTIDTSITLANGVKMPRLGLGTYRANAGGEVEAAVVAALLAGYRSFDTASLYANEHGVGRALAESGLPREELFIASKMWNDEQGYDATLAAFEASIKRLQLSYLDLYLVHWPMPQTPETWRAMERLLEEGAVRAIGVCNHLQYHLEKLLAGADVAPMVNQYEMHPWLTQLPLLDYCQERNIVVEAWAPAMRGKADTVPELVDIGARHGKTAVQVALRWSLQKGTVIIPKSVNARRIDENADVFDFVLSDEEMALIDSLDRNERFGPHPDSFAAKA